MFFPLTNPGADSSVNLPRPLSAKPRVRDLRKCLHSRVAEEGRAWGRVDSLLGKGELEGVFKYFSPKCPPLNPYEEGGTKGVEIGSNQPPPAPPCQGGEMRSAHFDLI